MMVIVGITPVSFDDREVSHLLLFPLPTAMDGQDITELNFFQPPPHTGPLPRQVYTNSFPYLSEQRGQSHPCWSLQ
jgi:hypothetical protein